MKKLALIISIIIVLLPQSVYCANDPDNTKPKHEFSFAYQIPTANSINLNYAYSISENNSLKFGLNLGSYYYDYQPQNITVYPVTKFAVSPEILIG